MLPRARGRASKRRMFTRCLHGIHAGMRYRSEVMFVKELHRAGHTRKFSIRELGAAGWDVRDEQDNRVLKHVRVTDWHRVERALNMFTLQIDELEDAGWVAAATPQ